MNHSRNSSKVSKWFQCAQYHAKVTRFNGSKRITTMCLSIPSTTYEKEQKNHECMLKIKEECVISGLGMSINKLLKYLECYNVHPLEIKR